MHSHHAKGKLPRNRQPLLFDSRATLKAKPWQLGLIGNHWHHLNPPVTPKSHLISSVPPQPPRAQRVCQCSVLPTAESGFITVWLLLSMFHPCPPVLLMHPHSRKRKDKIYKYVVYCTSYWSPGQRRAKPTSPEKRRKTPNVCKLYKAPQHLSLQ